MFHVWDQSFFTAWRSLFLCSEILYSKLLKNNDVKEKEQNKKYISKLLSIWTACQLEINLQILFFLNHCIFFVHSNFKKVPLFLRSEKSLIKLRGTIYIISFFEIIFLVYLHFFLPRAFLLTLLLFCAQYGLHYQVLLPLAPKEPSLF